MACAAGIWCGTGGALGVSSIYTCCIKHEECRGHSWLLASEDIS